MAAAYELALHENLASGAYVASGALARVLVDALVEGRTEDLVTVFEPLEGMLSTATGEARELLITGLLEGIQNVSLNRNVALDQWVALLGARTKGAWDAVDEMWSGRMSPAAFNAFVEASP